jgi:hypothetical protein
MARTSRMRPWVVLGCAALAGSVGGVALERFRSPKEQELTPPKNETLDRVAPPSPLMRPSGAPLASAGALAGLPPYPGARPQDLAREIQIQGMPLHIAWFSTADPPEAVIHYYEEKFDQDGKLRVSHLYNAKAGYVGYLERPAEKMHLISVLREGDETLVFPSSSEMQGLFTRSQKVPASLPEPAGARDSVVLSMKDNGVLQDSVYVTVPEQSLQQVMEFYRKGFEEKGWSVLTAVESSEAIRLEAKQNGATATVLLRKLKASIKPGVAVYVTLTTV